ncbi:MAG: TRAP transporter small permease [Nevskiales bacterium]
MQNGLRRWSDRLAQLEDWLLAGMLGSMIVLACLQILLRNGFDSGLTWIDPLLRVMVLWLGLLGALAASRGNRHIIIDVLGPFMGPANKRRAAIITHAFTAVVCAAIAYFATQFVISEAEFGTDGVLGLPIWILQAVIPAGFGLMALRYLALCIETLRNPPPVEATAP